MMTLNNALGHSQSVKELLAFIRNKRSKEMRSNSVLTFDQIENLVEENKAWILVGDNVAIILCFDNNEILRLSYYAVNEKSLPEIYDLLPKVNYNIVCDLIGKKERVVNFVDELKNLGFDLYAIFQRMICKNVSINAKVDVSDVELADITDAEEILEITYGEFDPLTARMHSLEELRELISRKEVLVVKREGIIAGFAIFNSESKKVVLLDHIIVRGEFRREKIGVKLLHYKFRLIDDSTYFLWVNENSSSAIKYHTSNGFNCDGVFDYIFRVRVGD